MDLRIAAFKEALDTFVYLARIDLAEIGQMLHGGRLPVTARCYRGQKSP